MLVTPTFVAGAIADEKSRGTLQDLLTAQLSSWEIVTGKLFGRLAQVGYVALAALPLLAVLAGFVEISFLTVVAVAIVSSAPLFYARRVSILASVWASPGARDAHLPPLAGAGPDACHRRRCISADAARRAAERGRNAPGSGWLAEGIRSLNPIHVLKPAGANRITTS